jgi:quercetin dioxygenase-like cupin family protein
MATTARTGASDPEGWRTLRNRHTGEELRMRRVMRDGQVCLELQGTLGPHQEGPPLHVHHAEAEEGTVHAGQLSAIVDGRRLTVGVGGTAVLPAGSAHRWWNAGDEWLRFSGLVRPLVDLDVFLVSAFDVVNRSADGRPSLFYMAHLAWRHRETQTILFAPRWFQRVLIPVVLLLGTALGRYRGTDWPGCPAQAQPDAAGSPAPVHGR